jgi:competence protein ComEC
MRHFLTCNHWLNLLKEEIRYRPLILLAGVMICGLLAVMGNRLWIFPAGVGLLLVLRFARSRPVILLLVGVMSLGWLQAYRTKRGTVALEDFSGRAVVLTGTVLREPIAVTGGEGFPFQAASLAAGGKTFPVQGAVWVIAPKSASLGNLDLVALTGDLYSPREINQAALPRLWVGDPRLIRKLGKTPAGRLQTSARQARVRVIGRLEKILPGPYRQLNAQILGSLLFGGAGNSLSREIIALFRQTGTLHVLVVSGTQISLLFSLIYFPGLARRWQRQRALQKQLAALSGKVESRHPGFYLHFSPSPLVVLTGLTLMSLYALLTQGGEPVARAAVMGGLIGLAYLLRGLPAIADSHPLEIDRYSLLAGAALVLLIIQPASLTDVGFQLSFTAVAGIAFLASRLRARLAFLNDFWGYLIASTCAAQLATLPILAAHFGRVPLIGFVSNLFIVPIAAVLLWLGLAALALGSIWWGLAWPLGWACAKLCGLMVLLTAGFAALPGGNWAAGNLSAPVLFGYYALLLAAGLFLGLRPPKSEMLEAWA